MLAGSLHQFADFFWLLIPLINIFDTVNMIVMKNKGYFEIKHREHHPQVSFGLFLIVLGLALLVATNDMLHLGGVKEYITWESAMIFIGVLLILNLQFTGGLLLVAGGAWFMMGHIDYEMPEIIKTIYWPAVIILIGLGFILSSLIKRLRNKE